MWSQTIGHKKQIAQLREAVKNSKVAHAYLFSGISGIGKRRMALALAKDLRCVGTDLHCLSPTGATIKVEVLRELKQKIYLHPLEGETKVVLLSPAEAMTEAGANALLKILEEPPAQTYFILISSQPARILPTIRSRCQRLEFSPLSEGEIQKYLVEKRMTPAEAKERAEFSRGSLEAALGFDAPLFEKTKTELENLKRDPRPSQILALSETWTDEEEKIPLILTGLDHLWHQKILSTPNREQTEKLLSQWSAIQNAKKSLEAYANKQLLFENLLFTLAA